MGVASAVAGVALIALAVFLGRRRSSSPEITCIPAVPSTHNDGNLEEGCEQLPDVRPPATAVLAGVDGDDKSTSYQDNVSPYRHTPAEADVVNGGGNVPPSASPSLDGQVQSSAEHDNSTATADDRGAGLAGEDAAGGSEEQSLTVTTTIATASTANMSTTKRGGRVQFHQRQRAVDNASFPGGPEPEVDSGGGIAASPACDRQSSAVEIGLSHVVLAAAQELASHCQVPGVSEAAAAVRIMANLVTDSRENDRASESRLRQCQTIVVALKQAAKVAEEVG